MKQRLYTLLLSIKAYFPSKLPSGMTELHKFMEDVITLSGVSADIASMKFVLSGVIMRLGQDSDTVSKQYLARVLRRAAAGQLAGSMFTEIKHNQQLAQQESELTQKKQQAEATANLQGTASGQQLPPIK